MRRYRLFAFLGGTASIFAACMIAATSAVCQDSGKPAKLNVERVPTKLSDNRSHRGHLLDSAASASSELTPQAQNYARHNHKYERHKCGVNYLCHDRVGGNELNAKHRNQKRAANGRTHHA